MKILSILFLICITTFAQSDTQSNKIDMHGGNYNSLTDKRRTTFGSNIGMSMFVDNNSSNKQKQK